MEIYKIIELYNIFKELFKWNIKVFVIDMFFMEKI